MHPFAFIGESQEFWEAPADDRTALLEARRNYREDRLGGNAPPYPAVSDIELAWWVWGVADMDVSQADAMRWLDIPRNTLQAMVKCWREYGLLPFKAE